MGQRQQVAAARVSHTHLDLAAVQVNGDDSIDAHRLQQPCHVRSGDRHTGSHLPVLPGVAIVRDNRRDAVGGGTTHRADHQQQLHHVLVHRRRRRLDDVNVLATHVFVDHAVNFTCKWVQRRTRAPSTTSVGRSDAAEVPGGTGTEARPTSKTLPTLTTHRLRSATPLCCPVSCPNAPQSAATALRSHCH